MIVFFTGTGNSEYLAKSLANKLGDEVVDSTTFIKANEFPSFNSHCPYIFLLPIYAWRMPKVFEKWFAKCSFNGNKKAYFLFSCGGDIGNAEKYVKKLCEKIGFEHMGTAKIIMPDNYFVLFDAPSEEESLKIIESADQTIEKVADEINRLQKFEKNKVTFLGYLCSGIVNAGFNMTLSAKKFNVNKDCVSCGKCVSLCMLNNIKLIEGKPVWGNNCTQCMACIGYCPTSAINYGKRTVNKLKYTCPRIKK